MAETKVEKYISKLKRIFCDWGWAKPTTEKDKIFYGNTAPIWRCPSPILLLICGIFHLLLFIILLTVAAYLQNFDGLCSSEITSLRNLLIFLFLINGVFQFYMSRSDTGTDKQWCRYITISISIEIIQLMLALSLGSSSASCNDKLTKDIAVACGLLGIISTGIFSGVIIYIIVKLYCLGNPLAYNRET
ncbi:hypothetical protein SteCoe_25449 [Stentor coeruleus]|uniref:Uncharacterized protein n=1 Tax=Stentor coeruleus TaxID=5963 RepID=A0A1R2BF94_9CILI|nr:hypothetical protein SteCoe_25449 [Stentor coeruleus]